jgi:HD superfamily phosphohydrolase
MHQLDTFKTRPHFKTLQAEIEEVVKRALEGYSPNRFARHKIIRDAVFDFSSYHRHEIDIIDSPIIQRLRGIFQTSLALFVYPCSNHSRFEHSLSCVGLAERVASVIHSRNAELMPEHSVLELRLAALLHDCGHGPFSHASEEIYGAFDIFNKLREENADLLQNPRNGAGEILSFLIVMSPSFTQLWEHIKGLYKSEPAYHSVLEKIDLERVALMILGRVSQFYGLGDQFFDQIINGPYDVDKLDYIHRDGYFTGLGTSIDVPRLLQTLHVYHSKDTGMQSLAVDITGVTSLEQLLFSKMLLFSVVYHHHKVRASFLAMKALFEQMDVNGWTINERYFRKPVDFLEIDDYDVLNNLHPIPELRAATRRLKNRVLPRGALLLAFHTVEDPESWQTLMSIAGSKAEQNQIRLDIANAIGSPHYEVHVDIPRPPSFKKISDQGLVRISSRSTVSLEDVYPTSGWVEAYSENRYKAYVFAPREKAESAARAALDILRGKGVRVKREALDLVKHEDTVVEDLVKNHKCAA